MAQAFDLDTPVVEAYSDLFFNVIDRRNSPDYLRQVAKVGVIDLTGSHDQRPLLAAALGGVLDDVLAVRGGDRAFGVFHQAEEFGPIIT